MKVLAMVGNRSKAILFGRTRRSAALVWGEMLKFSPALQMINSSLYCGMCTAQNSTNSSKV
jgi:hypothetical protein